MIYWRCGNCGADCDAGAEYCWSCHGLLEETGWMERDDQEDWDAMLDEDEDEDEDHCPDCGHAWSECDCYAPPPTVADELPCLNMDGCPHHARCAVCI